MASDERRLLGNTSIAAEWNSLKLYEDTIQNDISSFWHYVPEEEISEQSWNKTQNQSDVSFKFFLFGSCSSKLTSEMFHKSIVLLGLIIGFLGLVGNVVTVFKILYDKKFHTPTFVVIGCIAFSDLLFIVFTFVLKFSNLPYYIFSQSYNGFITVRILYGTIFYSSVTHIVLLSVIRYLLIAYPLQSKIQLTPAVIVRCSLVVWVFSSLFSALISIPLMVDSIKTLSMLLIRITYSGLCICAILTLHILKMKALRKSSIPTSVSRKMNVIILIILLVFICYQIAYIVFKSASIMLNIETISMNYFVYITDVFFIIGNLNYSCNPYILFFASILCSRRKRNQMKRT
ncbi:olfactory receptor 1E16-like [Saccostrea cucullata]|uniref:olfactory receptor 1E16-like n=1 Tax=Saccostrea cuccullata TaxID=36930 RepID=UPI002ED02FC6